MKKKRRRKIWKMGKNVHYGSFPKVTDNRIANWNEILLLSFATKLICLATCKNRMEKV